jgi:hypothetical protein
MSSAPEWKWNRWDVPVGWKVLIHGWKKNEKTNRYELKVLDLS